MSSTLSVNEIIDLIVKKTGSSKEEVLKKIQDTIISMDNMINQEGAAHIVANEYGINIDESTQLNQLTIDKLAPGQSNITVVGRVARSYPTRTFMRKDNTTGKVKNIEIVDMTGSVRVSLWDAKVDQFEEKQIGVGKILRIAGGNTKVGYKEQLEISVGTPGILDIDLQNIDEKEFPKIENASLITLDKLINSEGEVSVEGKVIEKRDIIEFESKGRKGQVSSIRLSDQLGSAKITFWNDDCVHLEKMAVRDVIKITNLKVSVNQYQDKELTYTFNSQIEKLDTMKYDEIKVSDPNTVMEISEIKSEQKSVTIVGKIQDMYDLKEFDKKDGGKGKLLNFTVYDNTGSIRCTAWGEKSGEMQNYSIGDTIQITNCQAKVNNFSNNIELSIGNYTTIKSIKAEIKDISEKIIHFKDIATVMSGITIEGKITKKFDVRKVELKDGTEASVLNLLIADTNGDIARVAVWNEVIEKFEEIFEDGGVRISNVKVRPGKDGYDPEITVYNNSKISEIDTSEFLLIQPASKLSNYENTSLSHLSEKQKVKVQGTIVQVFKPVIYDGCEKCKRKVEVQPENEDVGICNEHDKVKVTPMIILTFILDDNNDTCNVKVFGEKAEKLLGMSAFEAKKLMTDLSDPNAPIEKSGIEMKEVWVEGIVGKDDIKDSLFINANKISELDYQVESNTILDRFD